jgi:hypothetical protein
MTNDFYVYILYDTTGVPVYVGKGRGGRHYASNRRNPKIEALISFGGTLAPVKVKTGLTEAEAFELEKILIAFHGRMDLGTGTLLNLCDGGAGAPNMASESRERTMASVRGRKHTDAAKAKMSAATKGKKRSPEGIENNRLAQLGTKRSPEAIAKRLATIAAKRAAPGYVSPYKGKVPTAESRAKMSAAQHRRNRLAKLAQDNRSEAR